MPTQFLGHSPSGGCGWSVVRGDASAASESASALGLGRRVVELVVVIKRGLICLRELLAVLCDVRRGSDLLLAHPYLQVVGAQFDAAQRHEGQMAADEAFLDGGEL